MKKVIENFKKVIIEDEAAQGTAEYIMLLVALIAVGALFKKQILEIVQGQIGNVSSQLTENFGG